MKDVMQLKREMQKVVEEARAIVEGTDSLDKEQEARFDSLMAEVDKRKAEIDREEKLLAIEAKSVKPIEEMESRDFRDFGEFLQEVRFNNATSGRLQTRAVEMDTGDSIGYVVPQQFDYTIRQVTAQDAVIRPRATVIPAGSPPDSAITLVALDQSGDNGVYSGVKVNWVGSETGTRTNSGNPKVKQIKLEPQQVAGWIDVSDKLLRNSEAAGELVSSLLRKAIIAAEEHAFIGGDGVGKPLGFMGHSSNIAVTRQTAGSISYEDIINMYAKRMNGDYVWLVSRTALPALMTLKDTAGNLIWQPSGREANPNMLLGLPVIENERQAAGSVMLVDLSHYAIKDGSPLSIFIDPYTQKETGSSRIYAWWNVDGAPMLNTPLTLEDGVTTVSPFVTLA